MLGIISDHYIGPYHRMATLLITIMMMVAIGQAQDPSSPDQDETDTESIWIQAAFWPTRQNDTEPFFEVTWPIAGKEDAPDADTDDAQAEHVIVPPRERHWAAQFTIAETIEQQFPHLIAPSDMLSLEIRQIQDSDVFAIVLEVDDQNFNVTRAVHYLDRLVGVEHRLADQLLQPAPSQHAFATIPLDLVDFWRLDLRVVPGSIDAGSPIALVGVVFAPGLLSSPFFDLPSSSPLSSSSSERTAALDTWLNSRRNLWQMRSGSTAEPEPCLVLVTRYLRVVGQYALYAEVVRHDPSPVPISFEFSSDSEETETEVILAHWGLDRQLGGRILHVGGGQRRTVSLSSPIWYDGQPHAMLFRTLTGTGFHRRLETALLLDANTPAPFKLSLMLMEFLPPGAFIDPDEIVRLQRFSGVRLSLLGDPINIEAPASISKQNIVMLHLDNIIRDQPEPQWLNISISIHLRYQQPAAAGQHAQIRLSDPLVFVAFTGEDDVQMQQCPKTGTIWPQPFLVEFHLHQCPGWHTVVLDRGGDSANLEARIPRGNSDQQPFVQLVTFISTSLGAIAILLAIWSRPSPMVDTRLSVEDSSKLKAN